jgi:mono/diheme cytochrome c family protein
MRNVYAALIIAGAAALGWAASAEKPGEKFYLAKCASCHGKDGKGNEKMAKMFKVPNSELDLTGKETQGQKDEALAAVIANGEKKMPAFKAKAKPEELKAVLEFIRSLGAK